MPQLQEMTLADYMATLRRRWRPAVSVTAFVLLSSIYIAYSLPAVYESSATILIEQQGIPDDFVQTTINSYAEERLQAIYQRVLAATSVVGLIQSLDLYPQERQALDESEVVSLFRDNTLMEPQNVMSVNARTGREAVITFGYRIAFQYPDPIKARDVAESLSQLFVTYNSQLRAAAAARTTDFLGTEATRLQGQLSEVADRIAKFKESYPNNLPEDQVVNLATWERLREDLTQVEAQIRETRERKALLESEIAETPRFRPVLNESGEPVLGGVDRLAEAQRELIRLRGRYSDNHPEIINLRREIAALSSATADGPNLTQQLRADLAARRQQLSAVRETYSDSHPEVVDLRRNIESLEQQIKVLETEMASSGSGLSPPNNPVYVQLLTRIETADGELADLANLRNDLTARIANFERRRALAPQVEREYTALIHEQDLLLTQYRNLRAMGSEAALGEALETGDSGERLTIVEPALIPSSPVSPNRISISFLGIVLAIGLGLGVASLIEATDTRVRGQRDVLQLLDMPPMGIIPYIESTSDALKRNAVNATMVGAIVCGAIYVMIIALS